jgi:hypothetical protein
VGCNNVDHPPVIEPCDPDTMRCGAAANSGGGEIGSGSGSGSDSGSDSGWTGDIIEFTDDTFYRGSAYDGLAAVSAYNSAGIRTEVQYDGDIFIFEDLNAVNPNWFIVDPEDEGLFTTIQPFDTARSPVDITLGVSPEYLEDDILALVERTRILIAPGALTVADVPFY